MDRPLQEISWLKAESTDEHDALSDEDQVALWVREDGRLRRRASMTGRQALSGRALRCVSSIEHPGRGGGEEDAPETATGQG